MLDISPTATILDSSKIQDFMRCPRKAFFRHILGWTSEDENVHLIFGSAWHKAMEVIYTRGTDMEAIAAAYIAFETLYREAFSPDLDVMNSPKTPDNALRALLNYTNKWSKDLEELEVLHLEVAGTALLPGDRTIAYKIDAILRERSTQCILAHEHKTTKNFSPQWQNQWRQKFQLGTYSYVLSSLFPPNEVMGVVVNGVSICNPPQIKKDGTPYANSRDTEVLRIPVRWNPEKIDEWLQTAMFYYDWWMAELEALSQYSEDDDSMGAFPKCTESCGDYMGCPYLDYCCSYSNPLRVADSPPPGMKIEFWNPLSEQTTAKEVINV